MTNIFSTPDKAPTKYALFDAGLEALAKAGWRVERVPGTGKSSVRRITKGSASRLVSIKTTQDQWLAFARTPDDREWATLSEVDDVLIVSVNDRDRPTGAKIHLIPAADLKRRFDRAYSARRAAGHTIPIGRGIWISLYDPEATNPVNLVGAGAGLEPSTLIGEVPLWPASHQQLTERSPATPGSSQELPLTIAEAKRRLAATLGVDPSCIKITVEG